MRYLKLIPYVILIALAVELLQYIFNISNEFTIAILIGIIASLTLTIDKKEGGF